MRGTQGGLLVLLCSAPPPDQFQECPELPLHADDMLLPHVY